MEFASLTDKASISYLGLRPQSPGGVASRLFLLLVLTKEAIFIVKANPPAFDSRFRLGSVKIGPQAWDSAGAASWEKYFTSRPRILSQVRAMSRYGTPQVYKKGTSVHPEEHR